MATICVFPGKEIGNFYTFQEMDKDTAKAGVAAADHGVLARLLQVTTDEWNISQAGDIPHGLS